MITEEEEKAGIWEWENEKGEILKFKNCPNCKGAMLAYAKIHKKCGWNSETKTFEIEKKEEKKVFDVDAKILVTKCINEALDILLPMKEILKDKELYYDFNGVLQVADQIRRVKMCQG